MIHSYATVFQLGHKMIAEIFSSPVVLEEKIDGSSFSFGIIDGELQCRSKGKQLILDAPEKMFTKAVATAQELSSLLHPGWVYRSEFLEKPKHNVLAYERVPLKNVIIFDIDTGGENYLTPQEKMDEAHRLGLECVTAFYSGMVESMDQFMQLLETISRLGGTRIEGLVVKNYNVFTAEKKIALGKYVSERFKEVAGGEWRRANPTDADITNQLIIRYRTPARWEKAVQHLRERGELEESPRDIGKLIHEVPDDVLRECEQDIRDRLFAHFWPKIRRGVTVGLPEFYKEELAKKAFSDNLEEVTNETCD